MVRVQAADQQEAVAGPDAALAWLGYLLLAASATAGCGGLADGPAAALAAYALLLLGVALVGLAMLPLRPMERALEEERRLPARSAGNRHQGGGDVAAAPADAGTVAWCGYVLVAAPVLASWAGLVDGPGAAVLAYVLLLLGVGLIGVAVLALTKPKMA